jgi:PAS domain S-box-containing protein
MEVAMAGGGVGADSALLRAAIDVMPDPVALLAAVRDGDGRVVDLRLTYVNTALVRALGLTEGELYGATLLGLIPWLRGSDDFDHFAATLAGRPLAFRIPDAAGPTPPGVPTGGTATRVDDDTLVVALHDVSELEGQREAASQAEERYRALVQALPDRVVSVFDRDLVVRLAGGAAMQRVGFAADAVIGMPMTATLPDEHADLVTDTCRRALAGEHVVVPALAVGPRVWRFDVAPLVDPDGVIRGGMAVGQEITEQVEAQAEQERLIRELKQAQRLALTGSWRWDATTGEGWWSDELRRLVGVPLHGVTATEAYRTLAHDKFRDRLRRAWQQALVDRQPFELEQRLRSHDGSIRHLVLRAELVTDAEGVPLGLHGTAQDVTDQRQAQDALAESEERFRLAFDESPIGKALIAPAGPDLDDRNDRQDRHDGFPATLLRVNRALCRLLESEPDDLVGSSLWDWVHPDDRSRAREAFGSPDDRRRAEVRLLARRQGTVWAGLGGTVVHDVRGQPLYLLAQIEDVTARREAESELVRQARYDTLTGLPNRSSLV